MCDAFEGTRICCGVLRNGSVSLRLGIQLLVRVAVRPDAVRTAAANVARRVGPVGDVAAPWVFGTTWVN